MTSHKPSKVVHVTKMLFFFVKRSLHIFSLLIVLMMLTCPEIGIMFILMWISVPSLKSIELATSV